jgi:hypothetical protein
MANLNSESCHSLIGLLPLEYLGFLMLHVVPPVYGYGYITRTRKPKPGYLNLSILYRQTQPSIPLSNNLILFQIWKSAGAV